MNNFNWKDCYTSYVNLDHRVDRKEAIVAELARVGINAIRQRGITPEEYMKYGDMERVQKNVEPNKRCCRMPL